MGKLTMTRRAFAKLSAATVGATAINATTLGTAMAENKVTQSEANEIKRIRSCCRGCGKMECGVWVTVTSRLRSRQATIARKAKHRCKHAITRSASTIR